MLKTIKNAGAQGSVIVIGGKFRGQRAKSVKFQDGMLIRSGSAVRDYVKMGIPLSKQDKA